MTERLTKQLAFLKEIDKMKTVLRRSLILDGSRRENDAEHSWHLALMAMLLEEYAADRASVDICRVLRMVLVHDLVEVYAGDTFAYDRAGNESKADREREAADKLFGLPPEDQAAELRALWEEFDAMETPSSRYAAALDRLQPFIANLVTEGHTWRRGGIRREQVLRRMDMVRHGAPALWPFVEQSIDESVKMGWILP